MKYVVTFSTTVSSSSETIETRKDAEKWAREFVLSYLTAGAKRAGEKYRRLDANTFALMRASGGCCVISTIVPVKGK